MCLYSHLCTYGSRFIYSTPSPNCHEYNRLIDRLDGARTKVDDQMTPVWKRNCICAMSRRGFWRLLGQRSGSSCRMSRYSSMVKVLLHRRMGVLARVYVHFCGQRGIK